jgi:hypothetical protein
MPCDFGFDDTASSLNLFLAWLLLFVGDWLLVCFDGATSLDLLLWEKKKLNYSFEIFACSYVNATCSIS